MCVCMYVSVCVCMYVRMSVCIYLACVCRFVSVLFISSKCSHLIINHSSPCGQYTFVPRTVTFKMYAFCSHSLWICCDSQNKLSAFL